MKAPPAHRFVPPPQADPGDARQPAADAAPVDAAAEAAENARRIALMARAAGIGWWAIEGDPPRLTWSEELRRLVGLAPEQPVPPPQAWIERHVHPDDRHTLREALRQRRAHGGNGVAFSFRLLTADGELRDIVSHTVFERQGARRRRFGMLIDVSRQRRAARELRDERERTALATRAAGMGVWELDVDSGGSSWTEAMWRLRGLEPRDRSPTAAERMALVHPDDRERIRTAMQRTTARDEPLDIEFRVVWPDGRVRWLASRSEPLPPDADGRRRRIGVNWDVTDHRAAEQARREAEGALRESQAKSRFLARMSHELRTPLNAVLGFAQLLEAGPPPGATAAAIEARRREHAGHIRRAGEHLLTLINEVLDLARIEAGEMAFAREAVPLAPLVQRTLALVAPQAHAAGVHLAAAPAVAGAGGAAIEATALADETRLRQVLLNLLSNAIKYNRPGGSVEVSTEARGPFVHLLVRDSGRGIEPAHLAQLFQPFNRLGAERDSGVEGTGIGLAIVKSLVERMGGHVQVRSTPGTGSVFEVALPAATAPAGTPAVLPAGAAEADDGADADAEAAAARPAAAAARPPRRLLYIEDNAVNALIVRETLAGLPGYALAEAADGASGVAAALAEPPELVLLDMQLPDTDGFEVLRRLRAHPATATVPVVAVSANVMPEQVQRGLAAGLVEYWTKPLDLAQFVRNLMRLLPPPAA